MEGYIAEIRMFAANFAPRNWAYCAGQILAISSNSALFSLLGTTYGGNGQTTFALPDLRSRTARGTGQGGGLSSVVLGEMSGWESTTLLVTNLPSHTHQALQGISTANNGLNPANNTFGTLGVRITNPSGVSGTINLYATSGGAPMNGAALSIAPSGSNSPVAVRNPYLGMNYIICQYGIYPSRS